jgi:steroid 5-alpha-reductase
MDFMSFVSVLPISIWAMVAAAICSGLGLSFIAAPYGKAVSKGWGPSVPAQVAWMVMESPNLWVPLLVFYGSASLGVQQLAITNNVNKLALFCFLLHYVNRTIVYPLRMASSQCTPMPLSVMLAAFVFCLWNGFNQSLSLIVFTTSSSTTSIFEVRCVVGFLVFLVGFYINVSSDIILINAKKVGDIKAAGNANKYVIPTGGVFKYVSCGNYCKYIFV